MLPAIMNAVSPFVQLFMIRYGGRMTISGRFWFWFLVQAVCFVFLPIVATAFQEATAFLFLCIFTGIFGGFISSSLALSIDKSPHTWMIRRGFFDSAVDHIWIRRHVPSRVYNCIDGWQWCCRMCLLVYCVSLDRFVHTC